MKAVWEWIQHELHTELLCEVRNSGYEYRAENSSLEGSDLSSNPSVSASPWLIPCISRCCTVVCASLQAFMMVFTRSCNSYDSSNGCSGSYRRRSVIGRNDLRIGSHIV